MDECHMLKCLAPLLSRDLLCARSVYKLSKLVAQLSAHTSLRLRNVNMHAMQSSCSEGTVYADQVGGGGGWRGQAAGAHYQQLPKGASSGW